MKSLKSNECAQVHRGQVKGNISPLPASERQDPKRKNAMSRGEGLRYQAMRLGDVSVLVSPSGLICFSYFGDPLKIGGYFGTFCHNGSFLTFFERR